MPIIEATYIITTPMFLGGADPTNARELTTIRIPSFKGAFRFWWRALALARLGTVTAVRDEELRLFGSADTKIGQSKVSWMLGETSTMQAMNKGTALAPGLAYLAGQGLYHFKDKTTRVAVKEGATFTVKARTRPEVDAKDVEHIREALELLGLCGGLGARTRRGLGSIGLVALKVGDECVKVGDASARLGAVMKRAASLKHLPDYSAFSAGSRVVVIEDATGRSACDLLTEVGDEFVRYRSYGRRGGGGEYKNSVGEVAEQNFKGDHDLAREVANGKTVAKHPARAVFGLPHNYFFSSAPIANVNIGPDGNDRRASPLFLHAHERDGKAVVVVTFLPAQFLPEDSARIVMKSGRNKVTTAVAADPTLWQPVHGFLGRLLDPTARRIQRVNVTEVVG